MNEQLFLFASICLFFIFLKPCRHLASIIEGVIQVKVWSEVTVPVSTPKVINILKKLNKVAICFPCLNICIRSAVYVNYRQNVSFTRSTEPFRLTRWAYSIPFEQASFRRPSINFQRTARPIKAKFFVEPLWVEGTKVCSRLLGHMTKMAATPIYGKKNLLRKQWTDFHKLVCSTGNYSIS